MGCLSSKNVDSDNLRSGQEIEIEKDREIDMNLRKEAQEDILVRKLLLLGPGESGKSTFYKQVVISHREGFTDVERINFIPAIWQNIGIYLEEMYVAVTEKLGKIVPEKFRPFFQDLHEINTKFRNIRDLDDFENVALEFWRLDLVQDAWQNRNGLQVAESIEYFMGRLEIILDEEYVPTDEDILYLRARTTGALQSEFFIGDERFLLVDVGGQLSERRKWIKCFDNVTAVLYVAAIGDYNQVVWEDNKQNRLIESLTVLRETVNLPIFKNTAFMIFLNKEDLFKIRLKTTPLTVCFPEYDGETYEDAIAFVEEKFMECVEGSKDRIYIHITCATDQSKTKILFYAVRDTVIRLGLGSAGLLM